MIRGTGFEAAGVGTVMDGDDERSEEAVPELGKVMMPVGAVGYVS